jgi:pimeloyl-ACP methyl ester carboxylesterase
MPCGSGDQSGETIQSINIMHRCEKRGSRNLLPPAKVYNDTERSQSSMAISNSSKEAAMFINRESPYAAAGMLVTALVASSATRAADASGKGVHNVVLVHGAWGDALNWSKVIPLLEAKGLHVVAVQNPLTSLADDAATTKRAIALQDGPVLLVGHSYGGAVITEAGNDPKVVGLVYVAGFAPDAGQAAGDLGKGYPIPPGLSELRPDASGFLSLTPVGVSDDFGQDLSAAEKRMIIATQHPTAGAALGGKVTAAAWKSKPTWYIVAKNDRMIAPGLEAEMAKQMKAKVITADSSHLVMIAKPAAVADLIVEAAASLGH